MSEEKTITLRINGEQRTKKVKSNQVLSDFLREELRLTGTKEACGVGVCGLCTVWMDGKTVSSCILPAVSTDGATIFTSEGNQGQTTNTGLENGPDPRLWAIVQESFVECEGMQCGICTPGQVMSTLALLTENANPTKEEISHYMAGNLCRCTGYQSIIRAIQMAAERWENARAAL